MEKQFALDQRESAQLSQMEQERTNALAMVGALSLDMEQARKNLDIALEKQRGFLRSALSSRGVERYENARIANGAIIAALPDMLEPPPAPTAGGKPNGAPTVIDVA